MKLKIITLSVFILALVSCKSDRKEETNNSNSTEITTIVKEEEKQPKFNFPVAEDILSNPHLKNLTYEGHAFEEDIVFSEVNVLKTAEETYTFVFIVNDKLTNFDKLQKWKLAMMFFAENPSEFVSKKEQNKGYKTIGLMAEPSIIGDEVVVIYKDFNLKPKELKLIRMYLYGYNGEMNKNYYNINNVVLP